MQNVKLKDVGNTTEKNSLKELTIYIPKTSILYCLRHLKKAKKNFFGLIMKNRMERSSENIQVISQRDLNSEFVF